MRSELVSTTHCASAAGRAAEAARRVRPRAATVARALWPRRREEVGREEVIFFFLNSLS